MGCFSLRCVLTNTYIIRDDEIVAVPVEFHPDAIHPHHMCNAHDMFTPCGLPMFGVYDEYGSITVHKDDVGAKFNAELFHTTVDDIGRNFCNPVEQKRLEYFLRNRGWEPDNKKLSDDATDVQKMTAWLDRSKSVKIGLAIAHKSAWEEALNRGYRKPYTKILNASFVNDALSRLKACPAIVITDEEKHLYSTDSTYRFERNGIELTDEEEMSISYLNRERDIFTYPFHQVMRKKFRETMNSGANHDAIFNLAFSIHAINAFMNTYGFIWRGTSAIGQQYPTNEDYKKEIEWMQMSIKRMKQIVKKRGY